MRIFAPTPFRYSNVDYPYGYQEVPNDTLAAAIVSAGFAYYDMPVQPQATRLAPHLADHNALSTPIIKRFPTWPANTGILLASLVANSTASRTSNVVTITATGHGITTGSTYVGFRFYYPGSASLTAGFYDSILTIPDANTITFSATGANFGSESVNSAAAWTTATDMISTTIAGNTLKDQSILSARVLRFGDTGGSNKTVTLVFGGSALTAHVLTTSPGIDTKYSMRCIGTAKQFSMATVGESDQSGYSATAAKDITADQTVAIRGTCAAASCFIALWSAHLEIIP